MRGRSPDYSPRRSYDSPPRRGYGDRRPSPTPPPRGGRGGYGREPEMPTSLLVRNIPRDCTPEDLRVHFERYGTVKDVYLPKDFYTRLPRGFGFVQFMDPREAAEAQYCLDHQIIAGREITVVFAEENRKKPQEMRSKERIRGRPGFGGRRGSRSPRRFSPSPRGGRRSRSPSRSDRGYRRRSYTPSPGRYGRAASRSLSPVKSHRRTRDLSPVPARRSPTPPSRSRGSQLRANGRDEYGSRSPSRGGSPSAMHMRRRSPSPRHYSPRLQDVENEEL
ncbi:hypothetical protein M758_3G182300 [Ceratodon purpureus]|uniref:RRM domain-containing protein n=1 Tax=Ceratodon purpureus TaxID=3225 RepID=A0A8T0IJV0_CERPU|nr:hypothetical protein KC19_3G182000 [Ceratodon purpureus]KAG0623552.1 hypothetical protein M758_3G182300 [Ceratodon purpureus]